MSAAAKLRALERKAEMGAHGWDNDIIGEPLVIALPQIRAVVEAAEYGANYMDDEYSVQNELRNTLADLDEALK